MFPNSAKPREDAKQYRPSRSQLKLHIEKASVELQAIIDNITGEQADGTTSAKKTSVKKANYGCFKSFKDSAYIITNYAENDRARLNELLKIEAQIDTAQRALDGTM